MQYSNCLNFRCFIKGQKMGAGIRSSSEPAFWIPVHVVDPERPTEHSIFNVPAGIYHSQSVQMLL
jgi:hypothetical protein